MNLKKIVQNIFCVISTAAIISTCSLVAFASEETTTNSGDGKTFTDGTMTYTVGDNMTAEVSSCVSSAVTANILPEVDGYTITGIADGAFSNCTNLTGISIAEGISKIGEGAFYGCTSLQKVTIPKSVTEIESGTFAYCTSLSSVELNDGIKNIGSMAFSYCGKLKDINIPKTVTKLGDYPFMYCLSLEKIEIPDKITEYPTGIFYGCSALKSYTIKKDVTSVGSYPFLGCTSLTEIKIEDGNKNYTILDQCLYSADKKSLISYPCGLTNESFTIPNGTESIESSAFFGNENLKNIKFNSELKFIGDGAFDFSTSIEEVEIPAGVEEIGQNAFSDCSGLKKVTLNEGLKKIDDYAFYNDTSLNNVTIPRSVETIGSYAFGFTQSNSETDESGNYVEVNNDDFIIYGYSDTRAKKYARHNDITFESLNLDVKQLVIGIALAVVIIIIIVIVSIIVHKKLMKKKGALAEAEKANSTEEEKQEEDYTPILDENPMTHAFKGHGEDKEDDN